METYEQFYDSLESDSSRCLPEIRIKFALYLANLPNEFKYLALHQGNLALCSWLKANDIPLDKVFDMDDDEDLRLFKRIIYQEDKSFLESLKLLLEKVKDAQNIDINQLERIKSLLDNCRLLNRFWDIPSLPQIKVEVKPINYTEILPNDIPLEMIAIPAGEFMMGGNGNNNEKPIHQVTLKGFCLGKYPITQAQYQAIMGNNPSYFKGDNWQGNYQNHPSDGLVLKNNLDSFILRGGSWFNYSRSCRCAYRYWGNRASVRNLSGFRVALAFPIPLLKGGV